MKNKIFYTRLLVVLLFTIVGFSCKKSFLEITPKGRLIAQTTKDYQLLLNNLSLLNLLSNGQTPMGDEVASIEPYFSGADLRTQRLFRWDAVIYQADEDADEMGVPMTNIYLYNKVINEVMSSQGTEEEKKSIQAQAMAGRAWTYFLLINYYGKPYNANTSATDSGFPIITAAEVTETKFTRATVKEVYDFIINDLNTAMPELPTQITQRLKMSRPAAEGLLGKVYTFMAMYSEAIPHLSAAITGMDNATINVGLFDYNKQFATGGGFLPIGRSGPAYPLIPNNEELLYAKQSVNNWTYNLNELILTSKTVALFGASDLRRKFLSNKAYPNGATLPLGMLRKAGPDRIQFGVIAPELYLLRAECKARLNDLQGAKVDVEALRIKRMPPTEVPVPSNIASDQKALVKFILEERIREFAVLGFRWFDMRRLSVDPDYSATVETKHYVYSLEGDLLQTFTLQPERLVMRFAQKLMDQNPGMQNNP